MTDVSASVIIPSYGSSPHLKEVLAGLQAQTRTGLQIIVVHSGEQDWCDQQTADLKGVELVREPQRLFAGAARNRGAAKATGDLLLFVDNDCIPEPTWAECMLVAKQHTDAKLLVGAVGYAHAGGYWGTSRWLLEFSAIAPYNSSGQVAGHGGSCNMLIERSVFNELEGFDEDYRMGQDKLLFQRVVKKYGPASFVSEGVVNHCNTDGFTNNLQHADTLGYWSARVELHGGASTRLRYLATRIPGSAFAIAALRWCRIVGRVFGWRDPARTKHLPFLLGVAGGLVCWAWGYFKGQLSQA